MRARLKALLSYPSRDWWLWVQAWLLLLGFDLALRTFPLQKVQGWGKPSRSGKKIVEQEQAEALIRHTHDFVERAARHHLYAMTCLRRSLALQRLLARSGLDTRLQYGVRRENGQLQAHAWLEYQGHPIGEKSEPTGVYAPMKAG